MDSNPASLTHWVFDKEYPLHSNAAILNVGSAGSGKSYFAYNVLLPIYIEKMNLKTILICSRTGRFDYTLSSSFENPIYKKIAIDFVKVEESYKKCQQIRSEAIVNEFLERLMKVKNEKELAKITKDLTKLIKNASDLETIREELIKFSTVLTKYMSLSLDEVRDWSELLYIRGSRKSYNPILIVYEDYSGTDAFMKPYSDIHKLIYCRRHLHTTMLMNVQSLTTVSTNIRRNATIFICFSTLSPRDVELLFERIPINSKMSRKQLVLAFEDICEREDRNQKIISVFCTFPYQKLVIGAPESILPYYPS